MTGPPLPAHTAFISVGSNLGDKLACCQHGIAQVAELPRTRLLAQSLFYRTAPVDYLDQDWFVNAAIKVATGLEPKELLAALQAIQRRAGRTADSDQIRFGPRTLDLDIIFYDDCISDEPELTLPHPRMHKRRFVLQPLCDIDPKALHPVLRLPVDRLLAELDATDQDIVPL
ncbi:MAG: 2-amino-4-hydroxy-6-hydroxymethyldihydropteridine diphosphokinase [Desulfosarcinaceae bacterium]|nr:2-amino-4-hydroxy-6-hydroxymethyldihydropteridine diphosphokinase [Desulfosarcinaceae bacterium]